MASHRRHPLARCVHLCTAVAAATWVAWAGTALADSHEPAGLPTEGPAADAAQQIQGSFRDIWEVTRSELPATQKRDSVEREIARRLDYATLSRAALGPLAERFTREQYADFAAEYSRYVTWLIADGFARHPEHPVQVEEAVYDAERDAVKIRALGSASVVAVPSIQRKRPRERRPIELLLRERDGEWRILRVRIAGLDASRNFREQFAAVLDRSDPDALISELRRRNQKNDRDNPFAKD